jgi:hypothetical protein
LYKKAQKFTDSSPTGCGGRKLVDKMMISSDKMEARSCIANRGFYML